MIFEDRPTSCATKLTIAKLLLDLLKKKKTKKKIIIRMISTSEWKNPKNAIFISPPRHRRRRGPHREERKRNLMQLTSSVKADLSDNLNTTVIQQHSVYLQYSEFCLIHIKISTYKLAYILIGAGKVCTNWLVQGQACDPPE